MTEQRQRIIAIILTIFCSASIAVILVFMFFPALKDVRSLSRDVVDAQTELEAQYDNRKNLLKSLAEVNRIQQTTDDLMSQFIAPGQELVFITRIEEISDTRGVESTIRLSGVQAKPGTTSGLDETFDIGLVGTYHEVLSTIRDIERLPNITVIDAIAVRAGDVVIGGSATISVSIRGRIAFTPEGL